MEPVQTVQPDAIENPWSTYYEDEHPQEPQPEVEVELKDIFTLEKTDSSLTIAAKHFKKVTDQTIQEYFALVLPTVQSQEVTRLEINVNWCLPLTDEGFKQIASFVGTNFKNVKNLAIFLRGCDRMTDKGFTALAGIATNVTGLEQLTFEFNACNNLSDKGLTEFGATLAANLKSLKELNLSFWNCQRITKAPIVAITEDLRSQIQGLQIININ